MNGESLVKMRSVRKIERNVLSTMTDYISEIVRQESK